MDSMDVSGSTVSPIGKDSAKFSKDNNVHLFI